VLFGFSGQSVSPTHVYLLTGTIVLSLESMPWPLLIILLVVFAGWGGGYWAGPPAVRGNNLLHVVLLIVLLVILFSWMGGPVHWRR